MAADGGRARAAAAAQPDVAELARREVVRDGGRQRAQARAAGLGGDGLLTRMFS